MALAWVLAAGAHAVDLIGADGTIDGWGRPFGPAGWLGGNWQNGFPPASSGAGAVESGGGVTFAWTEGNDASPIDYHPVTAQHYVPAPGDTDGEGFDLEFLGWQLTADHRIKVLSISSVDPNNGFMSPLWNHPFHLGDVFIDMDGDGVQEFALTAGRWSTNLPEAKTGQSYDHLFDIGLYAVDGVRGITGDASGGFGDVPEIADAVGPFALADGRLIASADNGLSFRMGTFDYGNPAFAGGGQNENGTWVLEWVFDASLLGDSLLNMILRQTVECGNDLLVTPPVQPFIPEPATVALVGMGLASLGLLRRRRWRSAVPAPRPRAAAIR